MFLEIAYANKKKGKSGSFEKGTRKMKSTGDLGGFPQLLR